MLILSKLNMSNILKEPRYSIKEAAEKSGMSISWWRKKIFNKEVRYMKAGTRVFIPESTIKNIYVAVEVVEPISPE
jgi:hypothetical protein